MTTTSTDIAVRDDSHQVAELADRVRRGVVPREVVDVLKNRIAVGATDAEFAEFIVQAATRGLSPLNGQIWGVMRKTRQKEVMADGTVREVDRQRFVHQVGIAGLRLIAQRTGRYGGRLTEEWCAADGVWRDVWLDPKNPPAAARVTVMRTDHDRPIVGTVTYAEFKQPGRMWSTDGGKPAYMLAKCAEAAALRAAFPEELSEVEFSATDEGPTGTVTVELQRALTAATTAPTPTNPVEHERWQELLTVGADAGLDREGVIEAVEAAGLGKPTARALRDDRTWTAMLGVVEGIRDTPLTDDDEAGEEVDGVVMDDHAPTDDAQEHLDV